MFHNYIVGTLARCQTNQVLLPVKKGTNELWLVVSEDFGEWTSAANLANHFLKII